MLVAQSLFKFIRKPMTLALALSLLFTSAVYAESGDLDPDFYAVPVAAGEAGSTKSLAALQVDEKIVLAGRACGASCDVLLSRFNTDGTTDVTFNEDGIQTTDLGADEYIDGLAIQNDNKIVVSGTTCKTVCRLFVVRYTADGELDTKFAKGGIFVLRINRLSSNTAGGLAIRPNGRIVVSANVDTKGAAVIQLKANGTFDPGFGQNGVAYIKVSGFYGNDLVIQPDGKIIVAGGRSTTTNLSNTAIVRLAANGSKLNTAFGRQGKQVTDFGEFDSATSVALGTDGKIVLTARSWDNGYENFHVARYKSNGSLDRTFNGTGMVTTDITPDADDAAYDVLIQPDGKIVVVGSTNIYGYARDIVLVRYNPDGTLDTGFGTDGLITINYYSKDYGYSVVAQSDGKYIVAGLTLNIGCCSDFYSYYYTLNRVLP
jgi:uncharacterized delta-60 repeat protein